jgi:hypothetical protein
MPVFAIAPIVGGIIGAIGASKAGGAQANAANSAAQLQHQDQQASLAFQEQQWNTQQQNEAPWLKAGSQAENTLSGLLGTPGQGLLTPWTQQFQAPTAATEQNDPGYQFRLQQGMSALQNSAAARGGLLSGNTAQAVTQFGQDYASNEYSNVYNRALGEYQQSYNIFEGNQANQFNRLSALAGGGQVAASQLGQQGQAASSNIANINLAGGAQQGASIMAGGSARASGYAGIANALSGGLNNLSQYALLSQLLGNQNSNNPNNSGTWSGLGQESY